MSISSVTTQNSYQPWSTAEAGTSAAADPYQGFAARFQALSQGNPTATQESSDARPATGAHHHHGGGSLLSQLQDLDTEASTDGTTTSATLLGSVTSAGQNLGAAIQQAIQAYAGTAKS